MRPVFAWVLKIPLLASREPLLHDARCGMSAFITLNLNAPPEPRNYYDYPEERRKRDEEHQEDVRIRFAREEYAIPTPDELRQFSRYRRGRSGEPRD